MDLEVWQALILVPVAALLLLTWLRALLDIAARPGFGRGRLAWFLFVLLVPVVGAIVYFLRRPWDRQAPLLEGDQYAIEQIRVMSELRRCGAVSREEYERERTALAQVVSLKGGSATLPEARPDRNAA